MQDIPDFLDSLGIKHEIISHPASFRVEEHPTELLGKPIVKSLLIKDTKTNQIYMVAMPGEKRLDLKALADALATTRNRLKFLSSEAVRPAVGVEQGHVSMFNLTLPDVEGVVLVVDQELMTWPEIGFHPNVNTATVFFSPRDLPRIAQSMAVPMTVCVL